MGVTIDYYMYYIYTDMAGVAFLVYNWAHNILDTFPKNAPAFLHPSTIEEGQPEHAIWV